MGNGIGSAGRFVRERQIFRELLSHSLFVRSISIDRPYVGPGSFSLSRPKESWSGQDAAPHKLSGEEDFYEEYFLRHWFVRQLRGGRCNLSESGCSGFKDLQDIRRVLFSLLISRVEYYESARFFDIFLGVPRGECPFP